MTQEPISNPPVRPGAVKGYAMQTDDFLDAHKEAWAKVSKLDREAAVKTLKHGYGHTIYSIDATTAATLSTLEKVVLANGGPAPFGGWVSGNRVEVFND
jgi:poly-beta-hydroxyalkanoate depolymerase